MIIKDFKYRQAGVPEIWLVLPEEKYIKIYILKDGEYTFTEHRNADKLPVKVLDGCIIDMARIFAEIKDFDTD